MLSFPQITLFFFSNPTTFPTQLFSFFCFPQNQLVFKPNCFLNPFFSQLFAPQNHNVIYTPKIFVMYVYVCTYILNMTYDWFCKLGHEKLTWNTQQGVHHVGEPHLELDAKLYLHILVNFPGTLCKVPKLASFRPFVEMYTCKNYRIASHGNMEEKKQKAHSRVEYSTLPLSPSLRLGTQMTRAQLSECGANAGQFPFSSLVQSIFGRLVSSWTESTPFLGKWRTDLFVIGWESCYGIAALPECELEQGVKSVIYDSDSAIEETTKKYFFCGTRVSAGAT